MKKIIFCDVTNKFVFCSISKTSGLNVKCFKRLNTEQANTVTRLTSGVRFRFPCVAYNNCFFDGASVSFHYVY